MSDEAEQLLMLKQVRTTNTTHNAASAAPAAVAVDSPVVGFPLMIGMSGGVSSSSGVGVSSSSAMGCLMNGSGVGSSSGLGPTAPTAEATNNNLNSHASAATESSCHETARGNGGPAVHHIVLPRQAVNVMVPSAKPDSRIMAGGSGRCSSLSAGLGWTGNSLSAPSVKPDSRVLAGGSGGRSSLSAGLGWSMLISTSVDALTDDESLSTSTPPHSPPSAYPPSSTFPSSSTFHSSPAPPLC